MSLYIGKNRTIGQTDNEAIIFSPEYDTLISSRYATDSKDYCNIAHVLGEAGNGGRVEMDVYFTEEEPSGLDRREMYVDARDLQSENISSDAYGASLFSRGAAKLQEKMVSAVFDGEAETHIGPQYGRDYFLGDYVSTINEFGVGAAAQITEYIRGYDSKGYSAYPTFVMVE